MKFAPRVAPWLLGNLAPMARRGEESEHLFFAMLSGAHDLDFDRVGQTWADLSDVRLAAYDALLPDAWADARPAVGDALNHLKVVRDRMAECSNELRRVLQ
jgi:hypothetical protein